MPEGGLDNDSLQSGGGKLPRLGGRRKDARSDLSQAFLSFAKAGSIEGIAKFLWPAGPPHGGGVKSSTRPCVQKTLAELLQQLKEIGAIAVFCETLRPVTQLLGVDPSLVESDFFGAANLKPLPL